MHVFTEPKFCMVLDKLWIGTQYGVDYGDTGDHYLAFRFSYIHKVDPASKLSTVPSFLNNILVILLDYMEH